MRLLLRLVGSVFVAASLLGLSALVLAPSALETLPHVVAAGNLVPAVGALFRLGQAPSAERPTGAAVPPGDREITRLVIPRIDLESDVVPATLVDVDGGQTWQVPAFKVGHAEDTAGAGQPGNAVLLGHVTSLHSGNVFQTLDQARVGDIVQIFSNSDEFDYDVVSVQHVPRTESDVLAQGSTPAISMITCTGVWLPSIWDYTERLVVRAELVEHA